MTVAAITTDSFSECLQPAPQEKGWLSKAFSKALDTGARGIVTSSIKIATVTTLAGVGASSYLTIGATAIAAGVGAGLYAYIKDYGLAKYRGEKNVRFWDKQRLHKAKWALLAGVAGGAFGSWLAGTDAFKEVMVCAKEAFKGLGNILFAKAEAATVEAVRAVAPAPTGVKDAWDMASKSPQGLKDAAHDWLRRKDVSWEEKLGKARALAEEALRRGNRQAPQFLKDLASLEKLHGVAPEKALAVAPRVPVLELPALRAPEIEIVLDEPAVVIAEDVAPARDFREAALCRIAGPGTDGLYETVCRTLKPEMLPGDYVTFSYDGARSISMLGLDSEPVSTDGFIHEKMVSNGFDDATGAGPALRMASSPRL